MSIKINIGGKEEKVPHDMKFKSNIRKTLNGDILILDHEDIDIVVMPKKEKILTYAKNLMEDKIYATQNRLMKFLMKKGIIDPSSIRAGNIYSSIEGKILSSAEVNSIDLTIMNILKWLEQEKPNFVYIDKYEKEFEESLTEPDEEDSTELGEIPQKVKKGSIRPNTYAYGIYYENKK